MTTSTLVGHVSDQCRNYLGNPSQVCILTLKDDETDHYVVGACALNKISWEVLLINPDTDICIARTIIINPDDLDRLIKVSCLKKDDYETEFR